MTVTLHTKCRRCESCLKLRGAEWRYRIKGELATASRTWFGTLTLNPQEHARALAAVRLDLSKQGVDFEALPAEEQFLLRHKQIGKEITLFIKRIRKAGAPFRYLVVCEVHDGGGGADGLPHYHLLIHEKSIMSPMRKRMLQSQWRLGFSAFKLVDDPSQATYLAKYLSKSLLARVRASQRYGITDEVKPNTASSHSVSVEKFDPQKTF